MTGDIVMKRSEEEWYLLPVLRLVQKSIAGAIWLYSGNELCKSHMSKSPVKGIEE
jgi:hypothetical protein